MDPSDSSLRRGRRLLQAGVLLFLFALLVGLAVPRFAVPRLGLSAHLLGIMQGIFLMVIGLLWPKLKLTPVMSGVGSLLAIYGCFAAWAANVLGAVWRRKFDAADRRRASSGKRPSGDTHRDRPEDRGGIADCCRDADSMGASVRRRSNSRK